MLRCAIVEDSPRELEHLKECLARYSAERDIPLDDKAFHYWNVKTDRWETEGRAAASCWWVPRTGHPPARRGVRALAQMTGGMVGQETVDGIVMEAKGFWIIGLLRALIGFGQNAVSNRKFRAGTGRRARRPGGVKPSDIPGFSPSF